MRLDLQMLKNEVNRIQTVVNKEPLSVDSIEIEKVGLKLVEDDLLPPNRTINEQTCRFIAEYKLNRRLKGLFFLGTVGCGKTFASKIIGSYCGFEFYEAEELKKLLSEGKKIQDTKKKIEDYTSNLIIDDLGCELTLNDYGIKTELMIEVINKRHKAFIRNGALTIFTSNLSRDQFIARYGQRIYSRIKQMCDCYKINDPNDYRTVNHLSKLC